MHRRKRKRHVEGTVLASLVLLTAALAVVILSITLAGGVTGGHPNIPRVAAPAASPPPTPIVLPPDEPHGSTGAKATPESAPGACRVPVAGTAPMPPGGTPVTQAVSNDEEALHDWYADNAIKVEKEWQAKLARRRLVWQIDTWLQQRGSPMAGCAECYVENGERTGIPATLSVGIAEAESSSGMACYNNPPGGCSHNAFGMIGSEYRGGFATWQDGITANFDYLVKNFGRPQTMHDAPGYCVGDTTMQTVDDVMAAIGRLDAGWIQ